MSVASDLAERKAAEKRVEAELKDPTPGVSIPDGVSVEQAIKTASALEAKIGAAYPEQFSRTPRQQMLDASDVQDRNPDLAVRWANMRDPQKLESHKMDGYRRLTSEEGGKQLGQELVLMGQPKELFDQRVAEERQINRDRLEAHVRTMSDAVEGVARELRDKHGMKVDPKRLLVNEQQ